MPTTADLPRVADVRRAVQIAEARARIAALTRDGLTKTIEFEALVAGLALAAERRAAPEAA